MNSEDKYINYTPNPTAEDLDRMFLNIEANIIVYGHDHRCSIICGNNKWYINCGLLGRPLEYKNIARTGIVEINLGFVDFKQLLIKYDANSDIKNIERLKYPEYSFKIFFGI